MLFASFVVAEIHFSFLGIKSFLRYLSEQKEAGNLLGHVSLFSTSLAKSTRNALFALPGLYPLIPFSAILVIFFALCKKYKERLFLLIWLGSTAPLFIFRTNVIGGNFIHSTIHAAIILIVALAITYVLKTKYRILAFIALIFIVIGNLSLYLKDNFRSSYVLGHQPMLYAQQKQLVDYTYEKSDGKAFSICAVSNPLFVNYVWSVIYKIYGEPTYDYMPTWSGPTQTHGKNFLAYDTQHIPTRFLIIEPSNQYPPFVPGITEYAESSTSRLIEEKSFGELRVQYRTLLPKSKRDQQKKKDEYEQILIRDNRYRCFY